MAEKTQPNKLFPEKSPRILVMRAGAIGDTLMVTPLVRALHRTFPGAYLGFICSRSAYNVLRYNPHLDEVIPLAYRHLPVWLSAEKRGVVRQFRRFRLDSVLSLETHPDFTKLARRIAASRVITYDGSSEGSNLEYAAPDPQEHAVETHLRTGERLGVKRAGFDLEFHYPSQMDDALRERLTNYGIRDGDLIIGIHAGWGSRKQHPTDTRLKSWPADRFAQVIRWLHSRGARVVLTGSPVDRPLTEFIAHSADVRVLNMAGQLSLLELAALIRRLNLYISVDTGPAHIATALGTPLITLWGPAIIKAVAPLAGTGPVRILYSPPPCAPCYGTPLRELCQDNICMKQISVDEVITTVEEMLASRL